MQSIHGEAMKGCGKEAQTQVAIHAPKGPLIYYESDDGLGWSWASENRKTHYNLIVKKRVERCGGKVYSDSLPANVFHVHIYRTTK